MLRANTHTWVSLSDLSCWTYGDDGPREQRAVKTTLYRLRGDGYVLAYRAVIPAGQGSWQRVYRLVLEPVKEAR